MVWHEVCFGMRRPGVAWIRFAARVGIGTHSGRSVGSSDTVEPIPPGARWSGHPSFGRTIFFLGTRIFRPTLDPQPLDLHCQPVAGDSEQARGRGVVPASTFEGSFNELLLENAEMRSEVEALRIDVSAVGDLVVQNGG